MHFYTLNWNRTPALNSYYRNFIEGTRPYKYHIQQSSEALKEEEGEENRQLQENIMSKFCLFCVVILVFRHGLIYQPGVQSVSMAGKWFNVMLKCPECFPEHEKQRNLIKTKKMKKSMRLLLKARRLSRRLFKWCAPRVG